MSQAALIEQLLEQGAADQGPLAPLRPHLLRAVAIGLREPGELSDELRARLAGELVEWLRAAPEPLVARGLQSLVPAVGAAQSSLLAAISDALEGALGDQDEAIRRRAVTALATLGPPACLRFLHAAASDPSLAVAARAASCLAERGELDDALRLAVAPGDGPGRSLALLALREAKGDRRAAAAVVAGLRDPGPLVRVAAMRAAAALCLTEALPMLSAALFSVSEDERREALRALAALRSPDALCVLRDAASDDASPALRAAAALAVAELEGGREELLSRLRSDRDAEVRALALAASSKGDPDAALVPLLEGLADEAPEVCAAAAAALGKLGSEAAAMPLAALLDDPEPLVARAAALALARIAPARAGELLGPLLGEGDAAASAEVLLALWEASLRLP